ncbi:MAG TPA: PQQ-binding-like beta-propeller repeat protein [Gaiellaceae bacterium]
MRKAALAAAAVLLLAAGGLAAFLLYDRHAERDVRGSSTAEFVPTETVTRPTFRRVQGIVWPFFGYDEARNHVAPATRLRPPFRRLWVAGGRSLLEFPPAIAFGRLYLANGAGTVYALAAKTGARAWAYRSNRCTAASPAVGPYQRGTVYETFLNRGRCPSKRPGDGLVAALAVGDGAVRWTRRIGASETSPLVVGHRVFVGDWLGKVYALDSRTGRLLWSYRTGGAIKGGAALSRGRLYVGSYDGNLYALNAATGRLVWKSSSVGRLFGHGTFYSTPSVAYGRVYIGSTDHKVYSFGATSGKLRWSHSTGSYVYASPAVWRKLVLVGSYDHTFYAFDAATGAERWSFRAAGPISGSATVVNGVVYFAALAGRTYGLDARTGRLLWSFPDGRYSPVVADRRRLYLLGYSAVYGLVPR